MRAFGLCGIDRHCGMSLANAGALSLEEYDRLILRRLPAALPFLDATVRKELARNFHRAEFVTTRSDAERDADWV